MADLAARFDVPIDLHMEAVPQDMPFSDAQLTIPVTATNNPSMLAANIAAFERLLSHNPSARIVWDHLGVDETGQRTLDLTRRLQQAHPNLYLQIRVIPGGASPKTLLSAGGPGDQFPPGRTRPGGPAPPGPISASGIKPEWLDLIRSFPDRFVLGSDRFYHAPGVGQPFITRITPSQQEMLDRLYRTFLDLLPPDLARRVGYENAARIYNLN